MNRSIVDVKANGIRSKKTRGVFGAVLAASVVATVLMVGCSDDSNPANNGGDDGGDDGVGAAIYHEFAVGVAELNNAMFKDGPPSLMRAAQTQSSDEVENIVEYMTNIQVITSTNWFMSAFIEQGIIEPDAGGFGTYYADDEEEAYQVLEVSVNGNNVEGRILTKTIKESFDTYSLFVFSGVYENGVLKEFDMFGGDMNVQDGKPLYPEDEDYLSMYTESSLNANGNSKLVYTPLSRDNYRDNPVSSSSNYRTLLQMFENDFDGIEEKGTLTLDDPRVFPIFMNIMELDRQHFADFYAWWESVGDWD